MMKHNILRIVGIMLIIFYIYIRFVVKRLPRDLHFYIINGENIIFNYMVAIIGMISILTALIILQVQMKKIFHIPLRVPNNIFIKLLEQLLEFVMNALFTVKQLIANKVPNSYENLRSLVTKFYAKYGHKELKLFIYLIIIPHVILVHCFLFDVVIFFELNYFYRALPLVTIPLLFNIWLNFMKDITSNMESIAKQLIIEHSFLPDGKDKFKFTIRAGINKQTAEAIMRDDIPEYLKLVPFDGFLKSYHQIESHYKPYLLIFVYSVYLFGWLYVFLYFIQTVL